MNKPAVWILLVSFLTSYFLIVVLLTGEAVLPIAIVFLVLVLWFSVYKLLFKDLNTRELVTKMYADLEGALEGVREGIAQEEAQRRAVEERKEQALWERERRRHGRDSRPARDPAMDKYAGIIENRVREGERNRQDPEGQ